MGCLYTLSSLSEVMSSVSLLQTRKPRIREERNWPSSPGEHVLGVELAFEFPVSTAVWERTGAKTAPTCRCSSTLHGGVEHCLKGPVLRAAVFGRHWRVCVTRR